MGPRDGHDVLYASAGILWGIMTFARSLKLYQERNKTQSSATRAMRPLLLEKSPVRTSLTLSATLALFCIGYLFWRLTSLF
jgi:hypothetical protein